MTILALESSGASCSAALWREGRVACELNMDMGLRHSETLQAAADAVLEMAGIPYSNVDYFACGVGPGSYTGIRIALATVKALAFACEKPCLGYSTLRILAEPWLSATAAESSADRGMESTAVLALLDARNQRAYAGLYASPLVTALAEERIGDRAELLPVYFAKLAALGHSRLCLAGDGAALCAADPLLLKLCHTYRIKLAAFHAAAARPTAGAVCRLAAAELARYAGAGVAPESLSPVYLAATSAEREAQRYV